MQQGRGYFIVTDGYDGAGKTTVSKLVVERMRSNGYETEWTCNPDSGLHTGKVVRERLRNHDANVPMHVEGATDAMYFFAHRVDHNARVIRPYLEKKINVLCDRYDPSTIFFQATQGVDFDFLVKQRDLLRSKGYIAKPDLVLLFEVSEETSMRRLQETGKVREKFENSGFQRKLRENYRKFVELANNGAIDDNVHIIDAEGDVESVVDQVYKKVTGFIDGKESGKSI